MARRRDWLDERISKIQELKGEFVVPNVSQGTGLTSIKKRNEETRIVWAGDFHIPFHNVEGIKQLIANEAGADVLIVGGDLLDCFSLAGFSKDKSVPLLWEYLEALHILEDFSQNFGEVILLMGNHEKRQDRYIDEKVPIEAQFLFRKSILKRLADGEVLNEEGEVVARVDLPNVYAVQGVPEARWYIRIGNTLFAHPTANFKAEGRTAEYILQHFRDRMKGLDSVVVGHIHKLGRHYAHGCLCIEGGCLCLPLSYALHSSAKYSLVPNGYVVIVQDEKGNTDYNRSKEVFLGIIQHSKETEVFYEGMQHLSSSVRGWDVHE